MDYEFVFSLTSMLAMLGWVALLFAPLIPRWSDRLAGLIVPLLLSIVYCYLALQPSEGGGFNSFAEISALFANPSALLAGWIHFLAFDLLIGAWICRTGRSEGIPHWIIVPVLVPTFLFGPAGFVAFTAARAIRAGVKRGDTG